MHATTTTTTCSCGAALYNGECFNFGACPEADKGATKKSHGGETKKATPATVSAPFAFTLGGRVD